MTRGVFGRDVYSVWCADTQPSGCDRRHGNVFFRNDTIYSYGEHFPMAIRLDWGFLVNGDRYSTTTSQHQSGVRAAIHTVCQQNPALISLTIPFTVLRGFSLRDVLPISVEEAREISRPCPRWCRWPEPHTHQVHLLGRAVVKIGERYFLSGTDESARDPWNSYFLSELPYAVSTVAQALEALKPDAALKAEAAGLAVRRQGEWFLIPCEAPDRGTTITKHEYLRNRDPARPARHMATYHAVVDGIVKIKGTLRHTAHDHKMVTLPGWHSAYENTALLSLTTGGRVD